MLATLLAASALAAGLAQDAAPPAPAPAPAAPAGLQTLDAVLGQGPEARKGDTVTVGYRGWLQADGRVFDQTRGKPPFTFTLGEDRVIRGWAEGVPGMKRGGRRILLLPPDFGYGEAGAPPVIPGDATLVFEVELLRVEQPGQKPVIEIDDIQEGEGPEAKLGDVMDVHYVGTFLNGEKFDSSRDRGQTFRVELGKTGLIQGFTQGLVGLKQGGVRKVTIPYQLAYGEQGRPPVIPPKATLVFELELVKLESK